MHYKRLRTIIFFGLLILTTSVKAQFLMPAKMATGNFFRIGIKGGVNLARLETDGLVTLNGAVIKDQLQASLDTKQSYVGGIYARLGRKIFIEPEVLVSTKGGSIYVPGLSQTKQFTFTNIDVPVLLGFRWKIFHIMAGPVASYTLKTDTELNDLINLVTTKYTGSTAEIAAKTSFSYQVGGGIDLLGFTLDVRYEGNLSQLTKTLPIPTGITFSPKLNLYQVTLGYKIF
jgi:hypothetical protein